MMDALLTELNRSDLEFVDAPALAHQLQALPQKRRPTAPVRDVSSWFPTEYQVAQRLIARHLRNADPNLVALHLVAASVVGGTVADAHLMAAELDHITRLLLPHPRAAISHPGTRRPAVRHRVERGAGFPGSKPPRGHAGGPKHCTPGG